MKFERIESSIKDPDGFMFGFNGKIYRCIRSKSYKNIKIFLLIVFLKNYLKKIQNEKEWLNYSNFLPYNETEIDRKKEIIKDF